MHVSKTNDCCGKGQVRTGSGWRRGRAEGGQHFSWNQLPCFGEREQCRRRNGAKEWARPVEWDWDQPKPWKCSNPFPDGSRRSRLLLFFFNHRHPQILGVPFCLGMGHDGGNSNPSLRTSFVLVSALLQGDWAHKLPPGIFFWLHITR